MKIHKSKKKLISREFRASNVKAFATLRQEADDGDDDAYQILLDVEDRHTDDLRKIMDIMKSEYERFAKVPILDGLFGGKPCQRKLKDKKFLTIRGDEDSKFDKKKMWNGKPSDVKTIYNACDRLKLCEFTFNDTVFETGLQEDPCELHHWTDWGEWSKCDKKCEESGRQTQKRKCVNQCTKEEGEGKCKASEPTPTQPALTDTKKTPCTPCPDEDGAVWSLWGEWEFEIEGSYCGTGKKPRTRKRTCHDESNKNRKCKGESEEVQEFDLPPCPTAGGRSDYPEDNENVDDDETQGDDGGNGGNLGTDNNVEDDEATEDDVVELDDGVDDEDEAVTEDSSPDNGENVGGDEDTSDDMVPHTDDFGKSGDEEDGGNGQDGEDEGDDNDGGDGGVGDDGGDYNFHGAHDDEDEEDYGNGGDGDDYPEIDEQDSFDFGEFKPEPGTDYFEEYDTTESEE